MCESNDFGTCESYECPFGRGFWASWEPAEGELQWWEQYRDSFCDEKNAFSQGCITGDEEPFEDIYNVLW